MPVIHPTTHNVKFGENTIQEWVLARLNENASYRNSTGIDARMTNNQRMRKGLLSADQVRMLGADTPYHNIVEAKCDDLIAAFTDMNSQVWDKPWSLGETPDPDVPYHVWRTVAKRLQQDLKEQSIGTFTDEQILSLATGYKDQAKKFVRQQAKIGIKRMEVLIHDQLVEGGWEKAYSQILHDIGTSPTAFMRGPVPTTVTRTRFVGSNPGIVHETIPKVERLDYRRCFPSPDAVTPTEATNFVYIDTMMINTLTQARGMPGFDSDAIDRLMDKIQVNENTTWWKWTGTSAWMSTMSTAQPWNDDSFSSSLSQSNQIPVVQYYGGVLGKKLKGIHLEKFKTNVLDIDDNEMYECQIWIAAEEVIRVSISPMMGLDRPIQATSFRPDPASIWGRSTGDLLADLQHQLLEILNDTRDNLGYSARPITEVNASRFSAEDMPQNVGPGSKFYTQGDPLYQQAAGVTFTSIPDNSAGLISAFDYFKKEADGISGIPAQLNGVSQSASENRVGAVHGNIVRNSLKKIKKVDFDINRNVVRPLVTLMYQYNLLTSTDDSIKYEANITVRGTPALAREEARAADDGLLLQNVTQLVKEKMAPMELFNQLFREQLIDKGVDPEGLIPDPKKEKLFAELRGEVVEAPGQQQLPTGLTPGDGRSPDVPTGQASPSPAPL